ncbi:Uncharacterised protein [Actinomyces naeslundii]|nr:Uncharacterised protein [Actinomyces naeslundii]
MTEAPGCAVRIPDSLLRSPVSTALTLAGPASMFPAGIVGILRFFFAVRLRCAFNVSTMDTATLSRPIPSAPPSETSLRTAPLSGGTFSSSVDITSAGTQTESMNSRA